ncbi:hypothetical protein HOC01_02985 [archaeon]|jgi:hypothetical protein|nr:hypothetical protein [archaeon]MBT6698145.1 hypothetical protein [archaeon]
MVAEQEELEFYDVKTKAKFKSKNYEVRVREVKRTKRYFAVTKSLAGEHECWRVISSDKAKELGAI